MEKQEERLRKRERLCSKKRIDALFVTGGSHAMTAFPLKAVYRLVDSESAPSSPSADTEATVQVLVSVPKKHFKRAVAQVEDGHDAHGEIEIAPRVVAN